jgi:hypothetical protein
MSGQLRCATTIFAATTNGLWQSTDEVWDKNLNPATFQLQLNDVVSNTANIYFDFNAPIITNTVETTVKINVATHAPQPSGIYIELAPNPAQDVLYATVTGEMVNKGHTWELTDATGKVLLREQQRSETTRFSVAALPNGTYEEIRKKTPCGFVFQQESTGSKLG